MERYLQLLKEQGADLALKIPADSVVTAAWTVFKCRFGCGMYGSNHCCPPEIFTWRETQAMLDCYEYGLLFRCPEIHLVEPAALHVSKELFFADYYKVIAFASGPCKKCQPCHPGTCNFPKQTLPAMEACGIDVFATVRNQGLEIHTLREKDQPAQYFGLIMVE